MPLNFQPLSMMELRSAPGEVLDRVAQRQESFIVERNGYQMACLVPLSVFMPDIQPARLQKEFEKLQSFGENQITAISDTRELDLRFKEQGPNHEFTITIRLPHGYPNVCPKVFAEPVPKNSPHRWQDGSLCIFGAMELWNPGQHDVVYVLNLTRRWLAHFSSWKNSGTWPQVAET
jgi:hypothetical protein